MRKYFKISILKKWDPKTGTISRINLNIEIEDDTQIQVQLKFSFSGRDFIRNSYNRRDSILRSAKNRTEFSLNQKSLGPIIYAVLVRSGPNYSNFRFYNNGHF